MLTKAYPPWIGGVETHVKQLAEGLALRGHQVTVLACSPDGRGQTIRSENLDVVLVPRWATVRSMPISPSYPFYLRKFRPDVVHIHHPHPLGFISQQWFGPSVPLVVTWHSDIVRQKRLLQFFKPFQDSILKRAQRVIATSPNLMENSPHLRPYLDKCVSVPLGIDLDEFDQRMKSAPAQRIVETMSTRRPNLLFVGRLVEYKGLEYLIQALPGLDARLHVIGTGRLHESFNQMVLELDVADKVEFHGEVEDDELAGYYRGCDAFILPSIGNNEAFGIVQMEAMAAGKPVVSTDLPTGVPYVNQDGQTGLIVPPENATALAEALKRILSDNKIRERMGQVGRKRVEDFFGVEKMIEAVLDVYTQVVLQHLPDSQTDHC